MNAPVLAPLVSLAFVLVALGGHASGSSDDQADDGVPEYSFDWADVHAADTAPRVTLRPGADGTCEGHVRSHIALGPDETGVKSLTLAPVDGEPCVFDVVARHHQGSDGEAYRAQVDAAVTAGGCCTVPATFGSPTTGTVQKDGNGESSASDFRANMWCRLGDGWAHTGYPDPPTVVYTRVYHAMDFCFDESSASIEAFHGNCFANSGTSWTTDPDECYWSDWDAGPSSTVYLTIHGYFEKQSGSYPPFHDMWNTVHGKAGDGRVYCTGDIQGEYDGYATTNNCGATSAEPKIV